MFLLRFQCLVSFLKARKAFFFLVFRIEMPPNIGNRYTNAIAFMCLLERSCLIVLNTELFTSWRPHGHWFYTCQCSCRRVRWCTQPPWNEAWLKTVASMTSSKNRSGRSFQLAACTQCLLFNLKGIGCFKRTASKHVYYLGWNGSPAQVGCMRQALGPGALGKPRGSGWRGR